MDKKFLRTSGTAAILGIIAIGLIRKWYKSIEKKLDQERDAINQDLEDLGVPAEKLREEMEMDDEGDIVKALAFGTRFNTNWVMDVINSDKALESSIKISVTQETFVGRNNRESKDLVFYFDIPDYTKNFRTPRPENYAGTLRDAMNHVGNTFAKFCPKPKGRLIGLISVYYIDPEGEEQTDRVEITDHTIYEELADEYHEDGLVPFYEGIAKKTLPKSVLTKLEEWVYNENSAWSGMRNVKVRKIELAYRMSFKILDQSGFGISLCGALEALKYFINLKIKKNRYSRESDIKEYRNILFCTPGELTSFYNIDEESDEIYIDSYFLPEKESKKFKKSKV